MRNRSGNSFVAFAILLFALSIPSGFACQADDDNNQWSYRTASDSNSIVSSRSIWLADRPRADLDLKDLKKSSKLDIAATKFAEIQFGGTDSRTVAIAIEKKTNKKNEQQIRMFVDLDRDRRLTANEEITQKGKVFVTELAAEFTAGQGMTPTHRKRAVQFRPSSFGNSVSFATVGFLAGKLRLEADGKTAEIDARVFDTNCNGRFGDAKDNFLADFDGDGKLNRFTELNLFSRVFTRNSNRYLLLTKADSDSVLTKRIEGQGKVKINLDVKATITSAAMLLTGNDGNVYSKSIQSGTEFELPAGNYTFAALSLSLKRVDSETEWHYNFSAYGTETSERHFKVADKLTTVVSPLKDLTFELRFDDKKKKTNWRSGDLLKMQPTLFSKSGLVINNCWTGNKDILRLQKSTAASMKFSVGKKLSDIVGTSGFR